MNTGAPPRPPTARLASGAAVLCPQPALPGRGAVATPRDKKAMLLPVKN